MAGLPASRGGPPAVRIARGLPRRSPAAPALRWRTAARLPGGRAFLSVARDGPRMRIWIRGIGAFCLREGGARVDARPDAGTDPDLFARVLLDQVLPRALHLRGIPVLHASAVAGPRGAVVLVGPSGSGKSTLAALLALEGCPLLADDGVRLEPAGRRVLVHPTGSRLRLREGILPLLGRLAGSTVPCPGAPGKSVLDARSAGLPVARGSAELDRLFLLRRGEDPPGPAEALLALLDAVFRADPRDAAAFARDLGTLGAAPLLARVRGLVVHPGGLGAARDRILSGT